MNNELIIKINKDKNGQEVSLDNISIDAADALKVFIGSLSDFAKTEPNFSEFKITLKSGCVETALLYPSNRTDVSEDLENVFDGKSKEEAKVKVLKNIQDKIKANGLDYSVLYKVNDKVEDLTNTFKTTKFKVIEKEKLAWFEDVIFVEGELFNVGGKVNINAHIEDNTNFSYTVKCTKDQAKKFGAVYENTYVSILRKYKPDTKLQYDLIDVYLTKDKFYEYKNLYESIEKDKSLYRFDIIHDKIENILIDDNISNGELLKLMRLFDNSNSDKGIIRTILMALKRVEKTNTISDMYNNLASLLRGVDNKAI